MTVINLADLYDQYKCVCCGRVLGRSYIWEFPKNKEDGSVSLHFCCGCGCEQTLNVTDVSGEELTVQG